MRTITFLSFAIFTIIACSKSDTGVEENTGIPAPGSTKTFTVDIKQFNGSSLIDGATMTSCLLLEGIEFEYNGYEKGYEISFHDVTRKLVGSNSFDAYPNSTAAFLPSAAKDLLSGKQGNTTYTNWYNAGNAYAVTRIPNEKKYVVQYSWCAGEGVCKPNPCTTYRGKATVTVQY